MVMTHKTGNKHEINMLIVISININIISETKCIIFYQKNRKLLFKAENILNTV